MQLGGFTIARLASLLPPEITAYDISMYTVDPHWKFRWISVNADYTWRCLADLCHQYSLIRLTAIRGVLFSYPSSMCPFVLFSSRSLKLLRGGWEKWLSAYESKDYNALNDESFRLQAQAAAIIRNQEISQQIATAQYNLDLVRSGITSLWEVTLYPGPGNPFPPRWVMAQGRNNIQAVSMALQQNPGFVAGPVRRIR